MADPISQALALLRKARPEQMKRARKAGFDTTKMFLHGTQTSPTEVRPNFYVSRQPEIADVYARRGEHLLPHGEVPEGAAVMPVFVKKGEARTTNPMAGYSVVEDPTSVRSIWAEFDPANKDSANIMGSMAGAGALGAAAMPENGDGYAHGGTVEDALHAVRHHLAGGGQAIPPEFTSDAAGAPVDFRPLNFDALRQANAVRVTNRANPDGTTDTDPTAGFSIVSGWNDSMAQHGDPRSTVTWPDNPEAYGTVADMFANNPEWITPHKYRQILHSARELGMPDEQIYAPRKAGGGFLSGLFSGPDYLSTGEVASFANIPTQDETNADFFKADRALRLAREVQARADDVTGSTPAPRRQQVAAPAPAPAPEPDVKIPFAAPEGGVSMLSSDISPESVTSLPLAYAPAPVTAPASAAIDQATGKMTARIHEEPHGTALTKQQADYVIRTIAAETSGKSPEETQAIASVILNRINSGKYGSSPEAVLFAKRQFEPWMNPAGANYPMKISPTSQRYLDARAALEAAMAGEDITRGATNFWGPKSQYSLGREAPSWGRTGGVDIGETRFHKLERAEGGLVDDALHVVRERHADGEAVGQVPEMPAEEPRPLTIYRGNAPVADEAGGSGRETVPAFSYMPMPESVERQAARHPAYNPAERTWSDAGSTEGERLTRALGVEGELPKGETFMSPQPTGWDKYMPQRVPGTFLKRTGEAFNENADAVSEGLKAVREGNYGAGALGMVGGALGAAISPLTGMERVLVRDPYLRMTGNLKDAQAAEMAADVALTGGLRGMVKPFAKAGNLEKLAAEPVTSAYRLPSPAATGAATAAGAMLTPDDAEASKLSKAMEVARMAIPRELSPLGFYSHGAEAARGLAQAKGTPEQFAAMLQKSGVKGPEMEGFLKTFGGRPIVTQEEAAQYFKGAMPQVEETVLGGSLLEKVKAQRDAVGAEWEKLEIGDPRRDALEQQWENLDTKFRNMEIEGQYNPTKFGQYTLPGGENYREVLLKMPEGYGAPKQALDDLATARQRFKDLDKRHSDELEAGLTGDMNMSYEDFDKLTRERDIAAARVKNFEKLANQPVFQSGHWQDPNVLAHLRLADRTGPNGEKILHVEEIQSDWGQKGKKEGFQPPNIDKLEARRREIEGYGKDATPEQKQEWVNIMNQLRPNTRDVEGVGAYKGVPYAPYVTSTQSWTDLALKRALKEAAEGGYDKLVWTPGAEQAKRYDLSRHVDNITWSAEPDGKYWVGATKDGSPVRGLENEPMDAKKLEATFGKEIAEKIVKGEGKKMVGGPEMELSGLDLQTGGEGMKGYYDKIVPNQLSKLVKKLDPEAKIGRDAIGSGKYEVVLPNGKVIAEYPEKVSADIIARKQPGATVRQNGLEVPSLIITPAMRESILKGQTAFKDGGSVEDRALMLVSRQA